MVFNWGEKEKEKFYRKAEKELREAEISFIAVDRNKFGVRGWNEKDHTVQAVVISLQTYSYKKLNKDQKSRLKKLKNWECTDKYNRGDQKPVFMHSRLIITEL